MSSASRRWGLLPSLQQRRGLAVSMILFMGEEKWITFFLEQYQGSRMIHSIPYLDHPCQSFLLLSTPTWAGAEDVDQPA
jgi:hypothetical protein